MVRRPLHDDFLALDSVLELPKLHKRMSDVPHDFEAHVFRGLGDLVQSHAIHFDGCGLLLLCELDIAHVDSEPACLRLLLVLDDQSVGVECL